MDSSARVLDWLGGSQCIDYDRNKNYVLEFENEWGALECFSYAVNANKSGMLRASEMEQKQGFRIKRERFYHVTLAMKTGLNSLYPSKNLKGIAKRRPA